MSLNLNLNVYRCSALCEMTDDSIQTVIGMYAHFKVFWY